MVSYHDFSIGDKVYNNILKMSGNVYGYDYTNNNIMYYIWYSKYCVYNDFCYESSDLSILR